ncbi:hypothetical protein BAE44_0014184 [Dichanthelium oligosanthes]|uniref:Uncharacterized protein n=1 Tax=Dichanthelium oligosanthes TaxID=888268 RepID=A0A1E5VI66_9POAL|nr:hypothetical protein BAE44_0014184 [Dichanthelium oligosanthes]
MGLRPSKRVDAALHQAPVFVATCYATLDWCLADVQGAFGGVRRYELANAPGAFGGVRRYQLADAVSHLQTSLRVSVLLVRRWAPSPPAHACVDPVARPGSGGRGRRGRSSSEGRVGTGTAGQEQRRREHRDFSPAPRTA